MARNLIFLVAAALTCAGCSESPPIVNYQTRVIGPIAPDEVFDAAVPIMRREFGRATPDKRQLTITVPAAEYVSARDTGSARDLLGMGSTLRRYATLRIRKSGENAIADVRVDIERKDAGRRAAGPEPSRLSDAPSQTPIERDAATTETQNTVWTKVRRDYELERTLLDELRDWGLSVGGGPDAEATPADARKAGG